MKVREVSISGEKLWEMDEVIYNGLCHIQNQFRSWGHKKSLTEVIEIAPKPLRDMIKRI